MGKSGALTAWLREFCALVFTQTIQAFIYAIIISLIVASLSAATNEYRQNQFINTTSMGLINIFALTSVFKIEDMARRIFGLQKSGIEPQNPMSSLAKLAFMAHFGRRLLDNGRKMVVGVGGIGKGIRQRRKTAAWGKEQRDLIHRKYGYTVPGTGTPAPGGGAPAPGGGTPAPGGGTPAPGGGTPAPGGGTPAPGGGTPAPGAGTTTSAMDAKDQAKMKQELSNLSKEMSKEYSEAGNQIARSVEMALSGAAETAGAIMGGAVAAVIGGADGKNVAQATVTGMGVGDRIGETVVKTGFKVVEKPIEIVKSSKSYYKDGKKLRAAGYGGPYGSKRLKTDIDSEIDNL